MTDADPLPSRAAEYVVENPTTTPDEVLREADLAESRRAQVRYFPTDVIGEVESPH